MSNLAGPFFEIGPKNLLRRPELEVLARSAGEAGAEHGVNIVLTVPTALVAPIRDLDSGILVFAQGMDVDPMGPTLGRVTAESLADAGASGVMLNHDSNPMDPAHLSAAIDRARSVGLEIILCANTASSALQFAALDPTAILFEPPTLIGTAGTAERTWIGSLNNAVRDQFPDVLLMHAGGVSSPLVAKLIMTQGVDGTGSTSGVLGADDVLVAVHAFIAATRIGWDAAHPHQATENDPSTSLT